MHAMPQRGFTLLVAIILASVALALALALLDISYKQVTLALTAKQSQYAFANADSGLECALYWDLKQDAFNYTTPLAAGSITCSGLAITGYSTSQAGGIRTTSFTVPCAVSGVSASVTVRKQSDATTAIYSNGYNACDVNDARRIERGLKATF